MWFCVQGRGQRIGCIYPVSSYILYLRKIPQLGWYGLLLGIEMEGTNVKVKIVGEQCRSKLGLKTKHNKLFVLTVNQLNHTLTFLRLRMLR